jgi:hypothetical protein
MKEPASVSEYLESLPEDRRRELEIVRKVILKNLPEGVEEGLCYGMLGYFIPHSLYPAGYHVDPKMPLPFGGIAMRKNFMTLYLNTIYYGNGSREWFQQEYAKTGKKLDMGQSCLRFKKAGDLPLDLIGKAIARVPVSELITWYEAARPASKKK